MDITTLHSQLKAKQLQDFYIFAGPEWAVQKIYINQIAKIADKELKYIDSIEDIYGKLTGRSFSQKYYVYVVRDDKELMTNEELQKKLTKILGQNILILLITTLDKRLKFVKTYKDTITEFEPLKPMVLKKYIQRDIDLSDKNCDKLMEVCEYDYGRCLLEIDKIKRFPTQDKTDTIFLHLLNSGTIYQPPKDAIFDFVDAILDRKYKLSWNLYEQCIAVGEATMVMITVLYNNAKAVLQVQACESSDISKSTGLTGWQIQNAKKHVGVYRNGELIDIMNRCREAEVGIKTGQIEEGYVMEHIMVNVL